MRSWLEGFKTVNEFLKITIWPLILLAFLFLYHAEIQSVLRRVTQFKVGNTEASFRPENELKNALRELADKSVSPETTFAVVKAIKDFAKAVEERKAEELELYFSSNYKDRQKVIEDWKEILGAEIVMEVSQVSREGDKIIASVTQILGNNRYQEAVALTMEDNRWKMQS